MTSAFEHDQAEAVTAAYAQGLGLEPSVFRHGQLTIASRPAHAPWPYWAMAVSLPGGTVLSLDASLVEVARRAAPRRPFRAAQAEFLRTLAAAVERTGPRVVIDGPNISWSLSRVPEAPALPPDLALVVRDAAWMNAEQASGRFPNGVGEPGRNAREFRNRYAAVVVDAAGEPVAVGGLFSTFGLAEVGVDVVPERQGEGLGVGVVVAAVRLALERGETPLYGCAVTNIRSQRTAAAAGFVPLFTDATIESA
ncbi:MAG: hypothetical protein ACKVVT_18445 [Dehalococcoidia bacterium]